MLDNRLRNLNSDFLNSTKTYTKTFISLLGLELVADEVGIVGNRFWIVMIWTSLTYILFLTLVRQFILVEIIEMQHSTNTNEKSAMESGSNSLTHQVQFLAIKTDSAKRKKRTINQEFSFQITLSKIFVFNFSVLQGYHHWAVSVIVIIRFLLCFINLRNF